MQIILLSDVDKVGLRGEVVDVARGYARNFLLPRRLAEEATPGRMAELRRRDELRGRQEARNAEQAEDIAEVLRKTVLNFDVKAGPTGSLFGSVTSTDIADEIWRARKIRVDRRKIGLDEPLKRIGRYEVPITVFDGVEVEVKTLVVPEGGGVDVLEAAVEELEAVEADAADAAAEPTAGEPPATEGDSAVEEVAAAADSAPEVPEDAFDRAVDEAVGADEDERTSA